MFNEFSWLQSTLGSPVFLALVLGSIVTFGVVIERIHYYHKRRGDPDETLKRASAKIREGQLREAATLCEATAHPLGPVAADILRNGMKDSQSFEERLHIALSGQKLLLERNLGILGTMAAVAPLVGLLGTVWGIMRAFSDMSATGSGSPSVVAAGVAEALITTAVGIMIAVPSLMLYNFFVRRMNVMLTVAENNVRGMRAAIVSGMDRRPEDRETRARRPQTEEAAAGRRPRAEAMAEECDVDKLEPVR